MKFRYEYEYEYYCKTRLSQVCFDFLPFWLLDFSPEKLKCENCPVTFFNNNKKLYSNTTIIYTLLLFLVSLALNFTISRTMYQFDDADYFFLIVRLFLRFVFFRLGQQRSGSYVGCFVFLSFFLSGTRFVVCVCVMK